MKQRPVKRERAQGKTLKTLFLDQLRKTGNASEAARAAGIDRKTAYNWRKNDEQFSDHWTQALEEATDLLEAEARRRAIEGYDEPVLYAGRLICDAEGRPVTRKRYSDGLLRMLLRANRPSNYAEVQSCSEAPGAEFSLTEGDEAL
ncbi:hypothetical protein [Asaia astilbis]|uniref:hypothetical protein n=1 Tax=Asaia astilbis TaxID=610244 RepID=UPI00046FB43A|nr:hypothetical protein [Asaia astilbis]